MLLITAPSKGQDPIDRKYSQFSQPCFLDNTAELIQILKKYTVEDLCKLMKMSATLGETTKQRIDAFTLPFTEKNSCQALFTFQGDAYQNLTPEKYSEEELQYAQNHIRILSGLYGILRPLDLMMEYRLEMGTRLKTEKFNNLYQFWGNSITEEINQELESHDEATVINLASTEYSKVINRKLCDARIITITFKEKKGDKYKSIPIYSKRARGLMLHYAISKRVNQSVKLQLFTLDGYQYSEEFSKENDWIFLRDQC